MLNVVPKRDCLRNISHQLITRCADARVWKCFSSIPMHLLIARLRRDRKWQHLIERYVTIFSFTERRTILKGSKNRVRQYYCRQCGYGIKGLACAKITPIRAQCVVSPYPISNKVGTEEYPPTISDIDLGLLIENDQTSSSVRLRCDLARLRMRLQPPDFPDFPGFLGSLGFPGRSQQRW